MLISDREYNYVWDKIYNEFKFNPDTELDKTAFDLKMHYIVYDIKNSKFEKYDNHHGIDFRKEVKETIYKIFLDLVAEDKKMYALDWQHDCYKFDIRNKDEQKNFIYEENRNQYKAIFPSYYPNGDYYFFIAEDFSFGYLGHPWQLKVWIFGEELIKKFRENEDKLKDFKFEGEYNK